VDHNRRFEAYTCDLHAIAQWLKVCGIETVAMEATGIYWVQIFMVLQEYGFDVVLCNAKHIKNIGEKKTDYVDASWIQILHTYGLLKESFQPDNQIRQLKDLVRQRERLIQRFSQDLLRIQKALEMMNIKVHKVLSDIKGKSGIAILEAIIGGERRPDLLADLINARVKASRAEIIKSLEGNWNDAQLLILKQNYDAYRFALSQMAELDRSIEQSLSSYSQAASRDNHEQPMERSLKRQQKVGNAFAFDAEKLCNDILGVNLVCIPGISSLTSVKIISELGSDFTKKFPTIKHFCSWLNLVPNNRISGGKILSSKIPNRKNFVGQALRVAANTLSHSKCYLGDYFRRIKSNLGYNQAIIAVAHKLARIIYTMVSKKLHYSSDIDKEKNIKMVVAKRDYLVKKLAKLNAELNFSVCVSNI
jgi:transposase